MNKPKYYDTLELATDIVVKHGITNDVVIDDIVTIVEQAYGDGYCAGLNEATGIQEKPVQALEWWETQDGDDAWVGQHDLNDLEEFFGEMDLDYLQEMLEQIDQMEASYPPLDVKDLPPGFPFDRKMVDLYEDLKDYKIDLDKPLEDEDE
eukprot:GHVS01000516.1.p2 GENE.GHVS01000516.1~~GHVS01000516.1.p2  ORF type:complete len:150 (-),score=12.57 GHVS01000516.1:498-947(-)